MNEGVVQMEYNPTIRVDASVRPVGDHPSLIWSNAAPLVGLEDSALVRPRTGGWFRIVGQAATHDGESGRRGDLQEAAPGRGQV